MWGDAGRYGEIWGDMGRYVACSSEARWAIPPHTSPISPYLSLYLSLSLLRLQQRGEVRAALARGQLA